jgi:hypothetical protein
VEETPPTRPDRPRPARARASVPAWADVLLSTDPRSDDRDRDR